MPSSCAVGHSLCIASTTLCTERKRTYRCAVLVTCAIGACCLVSLMRFQFGMELGVGRRQQPRANPQLAFALQPARRLLSRANLVPRHAGQQTEDEGLQKLQDLASLGLSEEAEDAMYDLIDKGLEPTVAHYNALISACAAKKDIERADRWRFRMQALEVMPDMETYNALMYVTAKSASPEETQKWFEEAETAGHTPNIESFRNVFHSFRQAGETAEVERWIERMMETGLQLDIGCCNEVIGAFADTKMMQKAEEWMAIAEGSLGLKLNTETYNIAIGGHVSMGNMERAESVVQRLVDDGLQPNVQTYTSLIGDGTYHRDLLVVDRWSKDLEAAGLELDATAFESVIGAWSAVNNAERAEAWFSKMVEAGLQTSTALATVVDALVLSGGAESAEAAQEWIDQCIAAGMKLTPAVYAALSSVDVFSGDFEQVEARMQQMEADGIDMDEDSLTTLLLAYANAEPQQSQLAEQMFKAQMLGGKMRASRQVLEALRAAVGGGRCLALRRELKLAEDFTKEQERTKMLNPGEWTPPTRIGSKPWAALAEALKKPKQLSWE